MSNANVLNPNGKSHYKSGLFISKWKASLEKNYALLAFSVASLRFA